MTTGSRSDNLVDHRIDAANREVERGFLRCATCGFENFTRAHECALCAAPCVDTAELGESAEALLMQTFLNPQRELTPQQQRARKRKEWTRKLDLQGRMFWYRSAVDNNRDGGLFPGYTVRFHAQAPLATPKPREGNAGVDATTEPVLTEVPDEIESISERASHHSDNSGHEQDASVSEQQLAVDTSMFAVELELVDAQHSNPAQFAFGDVLDTPLDETKRMLTLASEAFPSKFAGFVASAAALPVSSTLRHAKLSLHREYLLEESMELVSCIPTEHVRVPMRIEFLDESGVDAGGIHREWFTALNELLMSPERGLFKCTNRREQTYYINANSAHDLGDDHLLYFYATGRLVGRALLDGAVMSASFSAPLLKLILGMPVSFSDLEYYDAELHRSLVWLIENDGVDALGLDFSVTDRVGDNDVAVVDLVPRGRDIAVTDENKYEYLDLRFRYVLVESVALQLAALVRGVYEVIPPRLLMLFDYEELHFLLCGTNEIDVDDWERHTRTSLNLQDNKRVLQWFWEAVREMSSARRRRLLQFATGCSRVPLVGFKGLTSYDGRLCPFTLKGVTFETEGYVRSHACFNMLELPLFKSKRELRAVLDATLEDDVYGFTIV